MMETLNPTHSLTHSPALLLVHRYSLALLTKLHLYDMLPDKRTQCNVTIAINLSNFLVMKILT